MGNIVSLSLYVCILLAILLHIQAWLCPHILSHNSNPGIFHSIVNPVQSINISYVFYSAFIRCCACSSPVYFTPKSFVSLCLLDHDENTTNGNININSNINFLLEGHKKFKACQYYHEGRSFYKFYQYRCMML